MDGWEALLVAGVSLLLLAGGLQLQAQAPPDEVAAHPSEAEAGRYAVEHVVATPTGDEERTEQTWVRSWQTSDRILPSGEQRELTTLAIELADDADREVQEALLSPPLRRPAADLGRLSAETSRPELTLHELSFGYTSLPGPAATVTSAVDVEDEANGDVHEFRRTATAVSPCEGAREALLVGVGPDRATDRLRTCLIDHVEGPIGSVEVRSGWQTAPEQGTTWTFDATVEHSPEGVPTTTSFHLRTSPQASLPIEQTYNVTEHREEGPATERWSARMTGWTEGGGPLPAERTPVEPGPRLELVRWTPEGPAEDGLDTLAFDRALAEAREDEGVQRFHERHEDARLYTARYVERHSSEHSRTPTGMADERGCSSSPTSEEPGLPAADEDATPSWELQWAGRGEHLEAAVTQRAAAEAPVPGSERDVVRTDSHTWASSAHPSGLELPTLAPSPQTLLDQMSLADAIGAEGDPYVQVHRPWHDASRDRILDAEVGRTHCQVDPATGAYESRTEGVAFEDGRAVAVFHVAFADEGQGPGTLASMPTGDDGSDEGSKGIPTGPVGWAGAAMVTAGLATAVATRGIGTLYSRFTSDDVLDSRQRQQLYDAIDGGLGVTFPELSDQHDMHPSSVEHHVTMLERHGLVDVTRTPAGTIVHQVGDPASRHAEVLARDGSREALVHLGEHGPAPSVSALAEALDVSPAQASRVADRLEDAGLLEREREGRRQRLRLTDEGRRLLDA